MKKGMTLETLATEVERRTKGSKDFRLPTSMMMVSTAVHERTASTSFAAQRRQQRQGRREMLNRGGTTRLSFDGVEPLIITPHAHGQMAARLQDNMKRGRTNIRSFKGYYDWMRQYSPELYDTTLNTLLSQLKEKRMVRTFDGHARSIVSDRYRIFDNWQVIQSVMPILEGMDGMEIVSSNVTDDKLYIKAMFPSIRSHVAEVGDIVQSGVVISNSEVGLGKASVELLVFRLSCLNGMISKDFSGGRHHVGRLAEGDDESVYEVYSDATIRADDKAFMMKLQDTVRMATERSRFALVVDKMREAAGEEINDESDAVEAVTNVYGLSDDESKSVLTHLIRSGEKTRWGVVNAVTRASQDIESYDRATELERFGGQILADQSINFDLN